MNTLIFNSKQHPFIPTLNRIKSFNKYTGSCYDDLVFDLTNADGNVVISVNNQDISDFDRVYFRHAEKYLQLAVPIANYLKYINIPFCDSYLDNKAQGGKLLQMILMRMNSLPIPKTIVASNELLHGSYDFLRQKLGKIFILKESNASHGRLNFLINTQDEYNEALKTISNPSMLFICQEFLPNSFDYRLVTIGGKVAVIKKRIRTSKESHLNNVFQGAKIEIVPATGLNDIINIAEKAAKTYNTEVAGVDILVSDKTGLPYVLEINRAPDISDDASAAAIDNYLSF